MYHAAVQGFVSSIWEGGSPLKSGCLYILFFSIYSHASQLEQIWSIILSLELPLRRFPADRGCAALWPLALCTLIPNPWYFPPCFLDLYIETYMGRVQRTAKALTPVWGVARAVRGSAGVWHPRAEGLGCPPGAEPRALRALGAVRLISHRDFVLFLTKNKFGFWFTNHEFIPHWTHQRPVKLIAFPSVYKAILYYKELIFLSHAWLVLVLFRCCFFFFKMCTLNISNLISSYELKLSAHNEFFGKGNDRAHTIKIMLNDAWSSNTS